MTGRLQRTIRTS